MRRPVRRIMKALAILVIVVGALALLGAVVMLLWNALVPQLFHGPVLQYWQALGVLLLSRILFGGLRARGWHHQRRQRFWREQWEQMTPEERAQLRERVGRGCRRGGGEASGTSAG